MHVMDLHHQHMHNIKNNGSVAGRWWQLEELSKMVAKDPTIIYVLSQLAGRLNIVTR